MTAINSRALRGILFVLAMASADSATAQNQDKGFFLGYETLEMVMNEFSNFAGEAGYRFNSKWQMRLTVMEVSLTERHLASEWEAAAVTGGRNLMSQYRIVR